MGQPMDQPATQGLPGVRPLHSYTLVIDARTPKEFAEDHLPGAINLPIVSQDEFAEVGTLHRTDPHRAYVVGAQYALRNVAQHIGSVIAPLPKHARLLVYCFRGGKRSRAWAEPLRNIGFAVDVLPGGWKAYRAWVRAGLAERIPQLQWRVLCGHTASGKTRLLHALQAQGAQVLDLEGAACHRGSLLGRLPDQPQPTQKGFDSALMAQISQFDPALPVWVEDESKRIGLLQIPDTLFAALRSAPAWRVSAPLEARVQACMADYPHLVQNPQAMLRALQPLKPLVGGAVLAAWQALADAGDVPTLFARVMQQHYDPCYARADAARPHAQPCVLADLQPASLQAAAQRLRREAQAPLRGPAPAAPPSAT